jgi:hypothetical protein
MRQRFTGEHVEAWRRDGALVIEDFFTAEEVQAVVADFDAVFAGCRAGKAALVRRPPDRLGRFNEAQFQNLKSVPLDCSPALNLIGVHPALIAFARAALGTGDVQLYQCQAWAKFTGLADYDQPFHCDFPNHTLTAPSEDPAQNAVTVICAFTDVSEGLGPTHYVTRPDSDRVAGPEATLAADEESRRALDLALSPAARSAGGRAGSIFPYGIDVYHRATNLTEPFGRRYTVTACFRRGGDDAIAFHAWPFHNTQPWSRIFDHASPEQLACFGIPPPGHRFWTAATVARTQRRYPGWDAAPYRAAM